MLYRAIGLMSGSSLDGLDIAYVQFEETAGKWTYDIVHAGCYEYSTEWVDKLKQAVNLSALDYQLLHTSYGHFIGSVVNRFMEENDLRYKVQLIASHGHTSFHLPQKKMTAQLGDGAAIAAITRIHVITDLRAMDIALGGQGAPIVPIGEKLLLGDYDFFLNLGGIANISAHREKDESGEDDFIAFDVCPANRVLNMLAQDADRPFDKDGAMAESGSVDPALLETLDRFPYYGMAYPKSLANDFGTGEIYPAIRASGCSHADALRTYTEHICIQTSRSVAQLLADQEKTQKRLLVTGGGAHNRFLMERLKALLQALQVEPVVPDNKLVDYKEAMIIALIGVLRWREENNVLHSVTGASRSSIGGAVWIGQ